MSDLLPPLPPPPAWWEGRRAQRAWREASRHMAHQRMLTMSIIHGADIFPVPGPCPCDRCRARRREEDPGPAAPPAGRLARLLRRG